MAESFGERLRRLRVAAALTQEQLAERARMSATAIAALERGRRQAPRATTVRALAEALGAPVEALTREPVDTGPVPPRPASTEPDRLPVPLSPLIGREAELTELLDDVRTERLVTVVGPGGVGKTRLTLQLARDVVDKFAGGVHWVELAAVTEDRAVAGAVLAALGAPESSSHGALDQVRSALARTAEPTLLVLDNCEHVLDAAADLAAAMLASAASLTVVATSRDPLHVAGELVWRLDPLAVPGEDDVDVSPTDGAPALFADRARRADRRFQIDATNAAAVAAICRRLDGLPLALELAASRVGSLPVPVILDQLDALDDLGDAPRGTPDRHRTLFRCVRWSYDLASDADRALLRALSVFAGQFDVAAVTGVTGRRTVLAQLLALTDRSLLVATSEGASPRFRLLETVRAFLRAEAEACGERDAHREAHAAHHAAWMASHREAPSDATVAEIAAAYPDVRAALVWCIEQRSVRAAELAASLGTPWYLLSRYHDAMVLGDAALAIARDAGDDVWAATAAALGFARMLGGDWAFVDEVLPVAVDVARRHGDRQAEGRCLLTMGLKPPWTLAHFTAAHAAGVDVGSEQLTGMAAGMSAVALGACAESDEWLAVADGAAARVDNRSLHGLIAIARADQLLERGALVDATELAERYAIDERVTIPVRLLLVSRLVAAALQRLDHALAARSMELGARLARVWNPAGFPGLMMTAKRLALLAGDRPLTDPVDELGTHLGIQPATLRMLCRTAIDRGDRLDPDDVARRAVTATRGALFEASIASVHAAHALVDGDAARARAEWERVLALASAGGFGLLVVDALEGLAVLEGRAGRHADAGVLLGAAAAERDRTDNRFRFTFEQQGVDEVEAAGRRALDAKAWRAALERGAATAVADLVGVRP